MSTHCPKCNAKLMRDGNCLECIIQPATVQTYRFTATLNRKHGARILKGSAENCPSMSEALYVIRAILIEHEAFEPDVTSLKITISPSRKNPEHG
jgi:hypothetical protein